MRLLAKRRFSLDMPAVLAFALPVLVIAISFFLAKIAPDTILPVDLSMRTKPIDKDIIEVIKRGVEDSGTVRELIFRGDGVLSLKGIRMLITEYMDPFFILSLPMDSSFCEVFLFFSYIVKFGLAGLAMFILLSGRIKCSGYISVLLSVLYSVSSVALNSSLTMSGMNLVILFPLLYLAMDEYITGHSRMPLKLILIATLTYISGTAGVVEGLLLTLLFAIFVSVLRFPEFSKAMSSIVKIIVSSIVALMLAGIVNVPRFFCITCEDVSWQMFLDGKLNFKLFDLFASTASGMPVNTLRACAPAMYIGVITVILVVLLFFNQYIPARIKAVTCIIAVIIYATVAYTPLEQFMNFVYYSTAYSSARLLGLVIILFVLAAISFKNLNGVSRFAIYGAGFLVIAIIMIANANHEVRGYLNYQLFFTLFSTVGAATFILSISDKDRKSTKIAFGVLAAVMVISNTSYTLMMTDLESENTVICRYVDTNDDSADIDVSIPLSVFTEDNTYVAVTGDLKSVPKGADVATGVNMIAEAMGLNDVFVEVDCEEVENYGFVRNDDGYYDLADEDNELVLGIDANSDSNVFVSSGFKQSMSVTEMYFSKTDFPTISSFSGPFIVELDNIDYSYEIAVKGSDSQDNTAMVGVYSLNDEVLKDVNAGTQKITSGDFLIEDGVIAGEGAKTIVTSIGYNSNIKATVNGKSADCFEYFGKTAVSLGDVSGDINVSISSGLDGLGLGLALFISGLTVVISYTIYYFRLSGGKGNA